MLNAQTANTSSLLCASLLDACFLTLRGDVRGRTVVRVELCAGWMVHDERSRDRAAKSFNSTVMLDPIPGLISMEHAAPSCAEKGGTRIFHKKSMENLWKSFNNILWTTDDSAIQICGDRIEICGDPDSAIGRKKPKKKESLCYGPG